MQSVLPFVSEKGFQQAVRDLAVLLGWTVWCTWDSRHSPAGEPDLRMVRPPRFIAAELKAERGRLTRLQRQARALLERCPGVEYYLWRPSDWARIEEALL